MTARGVGLFFFGLVLVSAMALVYSRHESRKLFVELQKLQNERDRMNVEWGQLLLEQGAWAADARVEEIAGSRLGMRLPRPDEVVILRLGSK